MSDERPCRPGVRRVRPRRAGPPAARLCARRPPGQPSRPGQGRQPVQGRPEHLGEQRRVDSFPGDLTERLRQGGEGVLQGLRGLLVGERQSAVELEHGVVDRRIALGEVEVGAGEGGDPGARAVRGAGRGPQRGGHLGGALQGDGADDLALAAEVAVEDGLAVLDALGEPAGGDRVPALPLGEFAGRRHDEALANRPFALLAFLYRHESILAPLDNQAAAALASPHHLAALDPRRGSHVQRT